MDYNPFQSNSNNFFEKGPPPPPKAWEEQSAPIETQAIPVEEEPRQPPKPVQAIPVEQEPPPKPVQPVQPQAARPTQRAPQAANEVEEETKEAQMEEVEEDEFVELIDLAIQPWRWLLPAAAIPFVLGFVISPRGLGTMPQHVPGVTPPLAGLMGWVVSPLGVGLGLAIYLLVTIHQRNHSVVPRIALVGVGYLLALGLSLTFSSHACPPSP